MKRCTVAMFGEAERGKYHIPYSCDSLAELLDTFGNPPPESQGLFFATQALLYDWSIIFVRVKEEGFSRKDYLLGIKYLEEHKRVRKLHALFLPGVGDADIIKATEEICSFHQSILITTEHDLYDYLSALS